MAKNEIARDLAEGLQGGQVPVDLVIRYPDQDPSEVKPVRQYWPKATVDAWPKGGVKLTWDDSDYSEGEDVA